MSRLGENINIVINFPIIYGYKVRCNSNLMCVQIHTDSSAAVISGMFLSRASISIGGDGKGMISV